MSAAGARWMLVVTSLTALVSSAAPLAQGEKGGPAKTTGAPPPPPAAPSEAGGLALVFSGDNAGEVDQCGCAQKPSGGLARRKAAIEMASGKGSATARHVLVLDAGNALFASAAPAPTSQRPRAEFILQTMARLGTRAMAVGARDLSAGVDFLQGIAKSEALALLSANLVAGKGKPVFPPSLVIEEGGWRVGVIGLSPLGKVGLPADGLSGRPPGPALLAEARRLRPKTDALVVLAAMPYPDALQLLSTSEGAVDFIIQSHDARGVTPLQESKGTFLVSGGDRGRQLGVLTLHRGTGDRTGPFLDEGRLDREESTRKRLDGNIAEVKTRLASAPDDKTRAALSETLRTFEARRAESEALLQGGLAERGRRRRARLEFLTLDEAFAKDGAIDAEARKFGPLPGQ